LVIAIRRVQEQVCTRVSVRGDVLDLEGDDVATAQLAVDRFGRQDRRHDGCTLVSGRKEEICRVGKARTYPRVPAAAVRVGTAREERAVPTLRLLNYSTRSKLSKKPTSFPVSADSADQFVQSHIPATIKARPLRFIVATPALIPQD
jgi:hypothetical protein